MHTGSYLDLTTTLYGWYYYDQIFVIVRDSGLLFLPLLVVAYKNWSDTALSQHSAPPALVSVRRMEFDIYVAILVILIAVIPVTTVSPYEIKYTAPNGHTYNGATAGNALGGYHLGTVPTNEPVRMPLIFRFFGSLVDGLNGAIIYLSQTKDIRGELRQLQFLSIDDPAVLAETQNFYKDCYAPSLALYQSGGLPSKSMNAQFQALLVEYGSNDISWIGSRAFNDTPGYYQLCTTPHECDNGFQANEPIAGWPWVQQRDAITQDQKPGAAGRPYCSEWWQDPNIGLRQKLWAIAGKNVDYTNFMPFVRSMSQRGYQDSIIRAMLNRSPTDYVRPVSSPKATSTVWGSVTEWTKTIVAVVGSIVANFFYSFFMETMKGALPIIQALILFGIYTLAAIYWVFAGYSLSATANISIAAITVKFYTGLWAIASWADNTMLELMYKRASASQMLAQPALADVMLAMLSTAMYIILPLLFTWLMNVARVRAINGMDSAVQGGGKVAERASQAGEKTVGVASKAAASGTS